MQIQTTSGPESSKGNQTFQFESSAFQSAFNGLFKRAIEHLDDKITESDNYCCGLLRSKGAIKYARVKTILLEEELTLRASLFSMCEKIDNLDEMQNRIGGYLLERSNFYMESLEDKNLLSLLLKPISHFLPAAVVVVLLLIYMLAPNFIIIYLICLGLWKCLTPGA